MRRFLVLLAILVVLFPSAPRAEGKKGKGPKKDTRAPAVVLHAPDLAPSRFTVEVEANDENGIAEVLVSLDGELAAGRTAPPWRLEVAPDAFPVVVCAVAQDPSGNTGRDCRMVHAPEAPACLDSPQCGDAEFCYTPTGECGTVGECEVYGGFCDVDSGPVCGCDGMTYDDECVAHRWGMSVAFPGNCPPCTTNSGCPEGSFCRKPVGECGGEGTCAFQYNACHASSEPACGCDGHTYPNGCSAWFNGVSVASEGECP